MDPRRFRALPKGSLNGKEGQPTGTDGSIGSPIQSDSLKIRHDQAEYLMKNNRKRKQPSSSGAANSTGTGNTMGPSPNSPSSNPFTHTAGDGVGIGVLYPGFTFKEVGCIRTSNSKVVCCHFSSDGKFLASAGHEKKV
ncbi:hypothetical protein BHM03_00037515 [Ensete ventricosum]|nr:hypothetical protein BHM03_00037515 [Ensete ventricosum]